MIWDFLTLHAGLLAELAGVFLVFGVVLIGAAGLLAYFEKVRFEDALYLSFVTAFTVGFGDIAPHSRCGRVVTVLVAFLGLVVMGILVAIAGRSLELALLRS